VSGQQEPTVRIEGKQIASGGTEHTILDALNVAGLCALTVEVTYDPAVKDATACQAIQGDFDTLLCAVHPSGLPNMVRLTGIDAAGVSGASMQLADITWQATGNPDTSTLLDLTVVTYQTAKGSSPTHRSGRDEYHHVTPSPTPTPRLHPPPCA
jgi:hypothetical protein